MPGQESSEISKLGSSFSTGVFLGMPEACDPKLYEGLMPSQEFLQLPRTECKPAFIYCTWASAGSDISIGFVENQLEAFNKFNIHPDIFIIDAGYCQSGDWFNIDLHKFPNGLKEAAGKINSAGIEPWLWVGPFNVATNSQLARDHSDWLAKDEKTGKLIKLGLKKASISPKHYVLDLRKDESKQYVESFFKKAKEWGFSGIKTDFLFNAFFLPGIKPQEAMDLVCEVLLMVKNAGLKVEGCGAPIAAAFVADYFRVTSDSGLPIGVLPLKDNLVPRIFNTVATNVAFTDTIYRSAIPRAEIVKKITGCNPDIDMLYCRTLPKVIAKQMVQLSQRAIDKGFGFTLGEDLSSKELPAWFIKKIFDLEKSFREHQNY